MQDGKNEACEKTPEQIVYELLKDRGLFMTTAESCSGGKIAARMVDVPGVSEVFKAGFVTYANEAKQKLLGVREETLENFGAVSEQTAREMALGAANAADADVAVSVTGIAGPGGGTKEKPVGLVYIGCLVRGEVQVREYRFSGSRSEIRENTVTAALYQLAAFLREQVPGERNLP